MVEKALEGEKPFSTNPSSTWGIPPKRKHFTIREHRSISHMNKYGLAGLSVVLLLCIIGAGCMDQGENVTQPGNVTQLPCQGQDPIVGAWMYDPAGGSEALILYLFKDYGRYDAFALPRDETHPLTYELWVTGSWINASEDTYNLTGQILLHDFTTDDLVEGTNNETLTYDPARDILFNENHPEGISTRLSCVAQVPAGMNVSIPFD